MNENLYRGIQERILGIVRRELAGESRRALPTDADILAAAAAGGESLPTPLRPLALAMRRLAELVLNEPEADDFHGVLGRPVQGGPAVLTASSAPAEDEIWDAIGRLPDRYQLVLLLHRFLGCPLSEVAEALRIPEAATRTLYTRAHYELQNCLVRIRDARHRDQQAFVRLYRQNRGWLRAAAALLIGEHVPYIDVEDLLQEAFHSAFQKIQQGDWELNRSEAAFRHYLGRVLRQKATDAARRAIADKRDKRREKAMRDLYSSTISELVFPDDGPTPSQHMVGNELASGVRSAIARLSEQDRHILYYRLVCHMSYEEMLPKLTMVRNGKPLLDEDGKPVPVTKVGTAKAMFFRAREKLLVMLRDQGLDEGAEGQTGS